MISDMIDAMRKEGNEATQLPSTGNSCPKTVCESQSQYVHPRDKNPPCLFHNISYMMEMDSESTQYISPEEQEQLSFPGSLNETLPIGSSFLIEEQEYGIPQTTTNPLFWTVTEYLPECRDSNSSEDECELDMHDHFAHEPSCILESLEFRAQQALKFIDGIHFK